MNIILGVGTLVLVLIVMTLFLNFAPYGKQGLQALSGAACATFLPQAFLSYAIGGVFHIHFFQVIGDLAGSLAGVAVGILTCVNLGISPVFAVIVGLVLHDFKLLPAFIAAYIISFGIKFIEKKVPEGLDLIAVILIAPAVAFGLATVISPGVMAVLKQIGGRQSSIRFSSDTWISHSSYRYDTIKFNGTDKLIGFNRCTNGNRCINLYRRFIC